MAMKGRISIFDVLPFSQLLYCHHIFSSLLCCCSPRGALLHNELFEVAL
jgi:hypothetical protein